MYAHYNSNNLDTSETKLKFKDSIITYKLNFENIDPGLVDLITQPGVNFTNRFWVYKVILHSKL